ncbi:hypothetical protein [Vibrio owensii]|uniref:hypothetical protein n=1 Tax=Vibrio owensii TaxID=696485 RepID=UPI00406810DC
MFLNNEINTTEEQIKNTVFERETDDHYHNVYEIYKQQRIHKLQGGGYLAEHYQLDYSALPSEETTYRSLRADNILQCEKFLENLYTNNY